MSQDSDPIRVLHVEDAIETAVETGEAFAVEVRFRRGDGEVRWLDIHGEPVVEDGEVVTLRGAVQDLSSSSA